ncbi:MAG: class I SAM-dependent methyltransferase [Thaumarchaeota archaeon]|nr:class I SAM-dependent methyltransferase [Nitrososphaerota archaeon]
MKIEAASYDVPAEGYDELYGEEQLKKYELAFQELRISVRDLRIILDVGCATGLLGEYLKKHEYEFSYVGIDKALDRLLAAKRKLEGCMLVQADAQSLPIRNESVDLAACITVIHLLDLRQAMKELRRVVRKAAIVSLLKKRLDLEPKLLQIFSEDFGGWKMRRISASRVRDEIFLLSRRL